MADCTCASAPILFYVIVLRRVVKILLRDGLLLRQRCIPIDVELRSALIGFRYRNLRLR